MNVYKNLYTNVTCSNVGRYQTYHSVPETTAITYLPLYCDQRYKISSVDFASYGTPFNNYSINASCHASNSSTVLGHYCMNKRACNVPVSSTYHPMPCFYIFTLFCSVFGADPCSGKNKWLSAKVTCSYAGSYQNWSTVPLNRTLYFGCDQGYVIRSIDFVSYGDPKAPLGDWTQLQIFLTKISTHKGILVLYTLVLSSEPYPRHHLWC
jgi:hypothetical protein